MQALVPARASLAILALLVAGFDDGPSDPAGYRNPCPATGSVVAVFSRTHELYLCRAGVPHARIRVALGRGGMGKRRTGDNKTPVGSYSFGEPRASARYGTFIPIDYPTTEQTALGYTGSELGIHGPPRKWKDVAAATALDWTTGCIATGTNDDIERIARFVREERPLAIIE